MKGRKQLWGKNEANQTIGILEELENLCYADRKRKNIIIEDVFYSMDNKKELVSIMKKLIMLLFALIIVTAQLAGCDDTDDTALLFSSPDADAGAETEAKPTITADEARAILQTWVDGHPFQLDSEIDPGNDEYTVDGVEYYRFYLGIIRFGVAEILVHKDTGEIFHLTSPYNDVGFEPADDWYNREHALNTSGSE